MARHTHIYEQDKLAQGCLKPMHDKHDTHEHVLLSLVRRYRIQWHKNVQMTKKQLESELKENSWLTLPATPEIVFNTDLSSVWELSLNELGIKPSQISSNFGNA